LNNNFKSEIMKTRYLFPNSYKLFGWIILIIGMVLGIILSINDFEYPNWSANVFPLIGEKEGVLTSNVSMAWSDNNIADELASLMIIIGGILVAFSKLKDEDEYSATIRTESLIWATYVNYIILILSIVFVFDMPFFNVLIYNMFTILLFFILRFHYLIFKTKKMIRYEE